MTQREGSSAAVRLVDAGHGAKDAPASAPTSGDRAAFKSPGPTTDDAAAQAAHNLAVGLIRSCAAQVVGGQAAVAKAAGMTPQAFNKLCDEREERSLPLARLLRTADTCPKFFDEVLTSLNALRQLRQAYGGRSLLQCAAAATKAAGDLMAEAVEDMADGVIDEHEERRLGEKAERLEREAREMREAVARSKAARLRAEASKG